MHFASDYILDESEEEEEVEEVKHHSGGVAAFEADTYDSDDSDVGGFECDIMEFSDEEEGTGTIKMKMRSKTKGPNMNTLNLPLSKLKEEPPETKVKNKQLYRCSNSRVCGAILSHIDKPMDPEADVKTWQCRFCGVERTIKDWPSFSAKDNDGNPAMNEAGSPFEAQDVLYQDDLDKTPDLTLNPGENTVIFVLDTSGSMAQTIGPHMGGGGMGGYGGGGMGALMNMMMGGPMSLPGGQAPPDQAIANKTRLTALRDAIIKEIETLKVSDPKCKVGVIAFNDYVAIFGDGSQQVVDVHEQMMGDYSKLLTIGQQQPALGTVTESCDRLVASLGKLREEGRTALGPAIVVAMGMAAKSKTSKLIVCTDGYANIGLGRLESGSMPATAAFYKDVNDFCKTQGVSASLISFDQCGIAKELGELPVETGGLLCLINPKDSDLKINEALMQKTMATDAFVNFVVHKSLFIDGSKVEGDGNQLERSNVKKLKGNLHDKMTVAFKFGFRTDDVSKQERIVEKKGMIVEKPIEKKITDVTNPDPKSASGAADPPNYVTGSIGGAGGAADKAGKPAATGDDKQCAGGEDEDGDSSVDPPADKTVDPMVTGDPPAIGDGDGKATVDPQADQSVVPMITGDPPADQSLVPMTTGDPPADQSLVPMTTQAGDQTKAITPPEEVEELPFQVQIYYVDLEGVEATRVWTSVKPVTANRQQAEDAGDLNTIVSNTLQTWSQRFLDINQGKIQDANLSSEGRKATEEIMKTMEQIDVTTKPNEHNRLNEFLELIRNIQTTQSISEEVAVKLRNFQQGKTDASGTQGATDDHANDTCPDDGCC